MTFSWFAKDIDEVLQTLNVTRTGLSDEEASRRLSQYGPNELSEGKRVSTLEIFLNQFKNIFVIMLIAATAVTYYIGFVKNEAPIDALTIATIVVLNAIVGFVQEYRSEKAMEAMKKLSAPSARVLRDGKVRIIPARDVVPGDILLLETGDRITADARLIDVVELRTAEAVLTGESTPVNKGIEVVGENEAIGDRKNIVFTATHIVYGRGKAVVIATGMRTEFGKIAEMVQAVEEKDTPLKRRLDRFAKMLGILVAIISGLVFLLEILNPSGPGDITESFLTAVALAVSAVPEGLPAVVTVTLALGARKLVKRNAFIRKLTSVETLGATTVICSDKTGTLTKGEMTVRMIYTNGEIIEVMGVGYEAKGDFVLGGRVVNANEDPNLGLLLIGAALCSNASYDGTQVIGDTTEGALLVAAAKAGLTKEELEKKYPRVREIPFTSERQCMTTVHERPDGTLVGFMKGAPEVVLSCCTHIFSDGEVKELSSRERSAILETNERMASDALRVLGVAFRESTDGKLEDLKCDQAKRVEDRFVFLGLTGMLDPPREEVKTANQLCQRAGIKTVMITGDHKLTAIAVAKEIGMMHDGLALTGDELSRLSDEEFENIVEDIVVYARVSPQHKLRIVKMLKKKNHIVAMTGDGVNDAPALKQADIGIAMGITGTDVTKEAADMVLADDNFATIVSAVEGGRTIYDNIRKMAFFLLRSNFDELFIMGTFALLGLELPLTAGMILWINLMTDGPPAIALSQDPPTEDVMERPPRKPEEGLLYGRVASILATLVTQFVGTGILFYVAYYVWHMPLAEARTLAFMQATMQELVVLWNCRSETKNAFRTGFTSNKYLLVAVVFSIIATFAIPYTGLFDTFPLTLSDWALVIPISLAGLLILPEVFYGRKVLRWQ